MRLTLPKIVLRYIQPIDAEHEARLAILWNGYRSCTREGQPSAAMEQAVLGEVFGIPEDQWHRFRPKPADSTAEVRREIERFAKQYMERQRRLAKPKSASAPQKVKPQKAPTVILRKHRQE